MGNVDEPDEIGLLRRLADLADTISANGFARGDYGVAAKVDGSPVTDVDLAIEHRLQAEMRATFPADSFQGEEVGVVAGTSGRTWLVDGIDGTVAFVSGRPEWSTLIALAEDEVGIAGVITSPALGARWWARIGDGAVMTLEAGDEQPARLEERRFECDASTRRLALQTPRRRASSLRYDPTMSAHRPGSNAKASVLVNHRRALICFSGAVITGWAGLVSSGALPWLLFGGCLVLGILSEWEAARWRRRAARR